MSPIWWKCLNSPFRNGACHRASAANGSNPWVFDPLIDTDGDGIPNPQDTDDDGDGMPDTWEIQYGLNALDAADASLDKDGDGIANREEYQQGTDPTVKDGKPDLVVSIAPVTSVTPDTFTSHVVTVSNTGVKAAAGITLNIQSPDTRRSKNGCSHRPTGEMFCWRNCRWSNRDRDRC